MDIMTKPDYVKYENTSNQGQEEKDKDGANASLEGIHGRYHDFLGGQDGTESWIYGHMASVATAAFDPIFWFHHCQIDRWFAIWQAINPNSWFPDRPGANKERYSDLLPFRTTRNPDTFWKADTVRDPEVFGYSYPDLEGKDPATVLQNFRDKYEWSFRLPNKREHFGPCPKDMLPWNVYDAQVFQFKEGSKEHAIIEPLLPKLATVNLVASAVSNSSIAREEEKREPVERPEVDVETRAYISLVDEVVSNPSESTVKEDEVSRTWYIDLLVER